VGGRYRDVSASTRRGLRVPKAESRTPDERGTTPAPRSSPELHGRRSSERHRCGPAGRLLYSIRRSRVPGSQASRRGCRRAVASGGGSLDPRRPGSSILGGEMTRVDALRIKIFADGADFTDIVQMYANPLIKGFTTNPTLMRKAGVAD